MHKQVQGEICECLNIWLCKEIICHSGSPYVSKVVIIFEKSGEICLCVEYRKLNSINTWDAFSLPCLDEALQVVHIINAITFYDLAQVHSQLAMEESDIKKTAFREGFSGLHKFTY